LLLFHCELSGFLSSNCLTRHFWLVCTFYSFHSKSSERAGLAEANRMEWGIVYIMEFKMEIFFLHKTIVGWKRMKESSAAVKAKRISERNLCFRKTKKFWYFHIFPSITMIFLFRIWYSLELCLLAVHLSFPSCESLEHYAK
jgi:hypothetical protein